MPDWKLETEHAEWEPRDSCVELVYKDHLWIMGGWFHQSEPNPRDVWKSADGKHWEISPYVFQDKLWVSAGHAMPLSNEVWSLELPGDFTSG